MAIGAHAADQQVERRQRRRSCLQSAGGRSLEIAAIAMEGDEARRGLAPAGAKRSRIMRSFEAGSSAETKRSSVGISVTRSQSSPSRPSAARKRAGRRAAGHGDQHALLPRRAVRAMRVATLWASAWRLRPASRSGARRADRRAPLQALRIGPGAAIALDQADGLRRPPGAGGIAMRLRRDTPASRRGSGSTQAQACSTSSRRMNRVWSPRMTSVSSRS